MSQGFKLKYDQLREGDPTRKVEHADSAHSVYDQMYPENENGRRLTLVWTDGKRVSLFYQYLVSCEYAPQQNKITMVFLRETIVLTGVNLETLFYDLSDHRVKQVATTHERYNIIGEKGLPIVNEIQLKKTD